MPAGRRGRRSRRRRPRSSGCVGEPLERGLLDALVGQQRGPAAGDLGDRDHRPADRVVGDHDDPAVLGARRRTRAAHARCSWRRRYPRLADSAGDPRRRPLQRPGRPRARPVRRAVDRPAAAGRPRGGRGGAPGLLRGRRRRSPPPRATRPACPASSAPGCPAARPRRCCGRSVTVACEVRDELRRTARCWSRRRSAPTARCWPTGRSTAAATGIGRRPAARLPPAPSRAAGRRRAGPVRGRDDPRPRRGGGARRPARRARRARPGCPTPCDGLATRAGQPLAEAFAVAASSSSRGRRRGELLRPRGRAARPRDSPARSPACPGWPTRTPGRAGTAAPTPGAVHGLRRGAGAGLGRRRGDVRRRLLPGGARRHPGAGGRAAPMTSAGLGGLPLRDDERTCACCRTAPPSAASR